MRQDIEAHQVGCAHNLISGYGRHRQLTGNKAGNVGPDSKRTHDLSKELDFILKALVERQ